MNSCVYKAIKSPCSGLAIAESIFRYSCAACSGTLSPASREKGFTGGPDGQESACNAGEPGAYLSQKDTLEKGMTTHSSFLAWKIPWTGEPNGL